MGCDIHAYVEYSTSKGRAPYWISVGGRINPGRDYDLFSKMAGVRSYGDAKPMFEPRGLPDDASMTVGWENQLYVSDTNPNDEGNCSRENAERWVAGGISRWANDRGTAVTHPDWHSHSWLSPAEFRSVLEAPRDWGIEPAYFAVLAMLEELERRGCNARLVFWFDN